MQSTFKRPKIAHCLIYCLLAVLTVLTFSSRSSAQTVTANFGGRSGSTPVIPKDFLGLGSVSTALQDQTAISTLTAAQLTPTRIYISLASVYATSTPNWSSLDWDLAIAAKNGLHLIAVLQHTPPSLQPASNPCSGSAANAPPTSVQSWGTLAASVVAHIDKTHPGVVTDYEIWNEPELVASLCVADTTQRLNTYISMFAAAAAKMHSQATADGQPIRTGGPVMSRMSLIPTWMPAFLTNSGTSPYINFVSFHLYITGQTEINNGMTWSQLYSTTQGSTGGLAAYYMKVYNAVHPYKPSVPIYLSEYNDNWAFAKDCCRNDPTYGPLWNSLALVDFLNVTHSGAAAPPSRLIYYAATAPPYFCTFGQWNTNMDCNKSVLSPYPQFYAFALFTSAKYLNLQSGGHLAASISPASTTSGLSATAFYTSTADNIVIVNPTSTNYSAVQVVVANSGFSWPAGNMYLLNKANGKISTQGISFVAVSGGAGATISVPAYSVVALSMKDANATTTSGAPTAAVTVTPSSGSAALTVVADSSKTTANGSAITGRTIEFGDGTWSSWPVSASHTYTKAGSFTVKLTVKNAYGTSTSSAVVTVK
jgi:PKD domain/Glycosyl hydrolases family 39